MPFMAPSARLLPATGAFKLGDACLGPSSASQSSEKREDATDRRGAKEGMIVGSSFLGSLGFKLLIELL